MTAAASVSAAILLGLSVGCATLLVLAVLAALGGAARVAPIRATAIILVAIGIVAAGLFLTLGAVPVRIGVPFHLAGARPLLVLDGLSGFFLLALLPVGVAALAMGAACGGMAVLLAGAVLALLAGEVATLVLGVAVVVLAAALMLRQGEAGTWPLAWVLAAGLPALAMALSVPAGDGGFATLRANPPEGMAAAAMLVLTLAGAGAIAALVPGQGWLQRAAVAPARPENALAGALVCGIGAYLLVRVLFDLAGGASAGAANAVPAWWGVPLLAAGAVGSVRGAAQAAIASDLRAMLAGMTLAQSGVVALGLGMALAARAVDDGPAAMLALGGALFIVLAMGWAQALWAVVAGGVAKGAGTQQIGLLGGLAQRMRITTIAALAGALALAAMPPGAGFAGMLLLLRAAATLPRGGGADWWLIGLVAALALALAGALLGFAVLRVLGVAFLGRPRTPRTAAAEDVSPGLRWTMLALAAAVLGCGVLPGIVLGLAGPALRLLAGPVAQGAGPQGFDGFLPVTLLGLLAAAVIGVLLGVRALGPAGHRAAPGWDSGQGPGPAWLPFGDPATQLGATGFARYLGDGVRFIAAGPAVPAPGWLRSTLGPVAAWLLVMPRRNGPAVFGGLVLAVLLLHAVGLW